jgi:hypothetical protein
MLSNVWHSEVMVGRFNVRIGNSEQDWAIWDNGANGQRGSGLSEQDAHEQAAELELQYDAHGYHDAETVRRVDPPIPVDVFQPAGVLDAWVRENGEWIGRVRGLNGRYAWIRRADLRQTERG